MTDKNDYKSIDADTLKSLRDFLNAVLKQDKTMQEQHESELPNIDDIQAADMRPHLQKLHQMWNISLDAEKRRTEDKIEAEKWFRCLSELNKTWDIRSDLTSLNRSSEDIAELQHHYPELMKQYIGLSPAKGAELQNTLHSFREMMSGPMEALHESWNIDSSGTYSSSEIRSGGLKGKIKKLLRKIVRIHTDEVFQKQRDFNAQVISSLDTLIEQIHSYQRRETAYLLELSNRQHHFNETVVRFVNTFLQDVILKRQREFNAEVVQSFQTILQKLPKLFTERNDILLNEIMAQLENLKQSVKMMAEGPSSDNRHE